MFTVVLVGKTVCLNDRSVFGFFFQCTKKGNVCMNHLKEMQTISSYDSPVPSDV